MDANTSWIIAQFQNYLALPIVFLACYRIKGKSLYIKLIGVFALISFLTHIFLVYIVFGFQLKVWNNVTYNVYTLVENFIISLIYLQVFEGAKSRRIIALTVIGYLFLGIVNCFFWQGWGARGSYNDTVGSLLLLFVSVVFLFQQVIRHSPDRKITDTPVFWFNIAILLLNAGSFLLFLITEYLVNVVKSDLASYWVFFNFLRGIHLIIIAVAVLIDNLQRKEIDIAFDGTDSHENRVVG